MVGRESEGRPVLGMEDNPHGDAIGVRAAASTAGPHGFPLAVQFLRYLLFSGAAAATNLATGYLLYERLGLSRGWQYGAAVSAAFLAGMGVSFLLNRRFTFGPSGRSARDQIRTFTVVSLGGMLLTVGLAYLFRVSVALWVVSPAGLAVYLPDGASGEVVSHWLAVAVGMFYSFICHKYLSFGRGIGHYAAVLKAWSMAR